MMKPAEVLHPVKDAARLLGISVWTLRKKAHERGIGSVKIGSKLLIPQSEVDWIIEAGTRPRRSVTGRERGSPECAAADGQALEVATTRTEKRPKGGRR